MSAGSFQVREATLLSQLTEATADRARVEVDLAEKLASQTASFDAEHRRLVSGAAQVFGGEFRTAEAGKTAELTAFDAAAIAKLATFDEKSAAMEKALVTKATALKQKVERDHQDAKWLAETMIEPGEQKLREAAEAWTRAVDSLKKDAGALLEAHQDAYATRSKDPFRPLAPAAPIEIIGIGPQPAHDLAVESLKALTDGLAPFRAAANPVCGRLGVTIVAAMIAGAAGVGGAIAAKSGTQIIAIAGGGAALLTIAVLQLIAAGARRHLPARADSARTHAGRIEALMPVILERSQLERAEGSVWLRKRRDDEVSRANEQFRAGMRAVDKLSKIEIPDLRARSVAERERLVAEAAAARAAIEARWKATIDQFTGARDEVVSKADANRDQRRAGLEQDKQRTLEELRARWRERTDAAYATVRQVIDDAQASDREHEQRSPGDLAASRGVRFGTLHVDVASLPGATGNDDACVLPGPAKFELPAMLDLAGVGGLLAFAADKAKESEGGREATLALLRAIMARLLTRLPPGKVRFTIFDPVGLGQNFAGFMHLADADPLLVTGRIWTESKDIEQRLADLTEHMETVIQKYLRNEYAAIQDYNVAAGEVAEPYRFLILADFPNNITEQAARRLASIVNSGARCGVFTLIAADARDRVSLKGPLADLEKNCLTMTRREGRFVIDSEPFSRWPLEVIPAPGDAELTTIVRTIGERAKDASRVRVPFPMITPPPEKFWTASNTQELSVPLGRAGAKKIQQLVFGRGTAQHGLIAGRTGSGKSTLLHVIITNAAMWFGPDQLEMYLVDFKKGVEFKAYAAAGLPHARVIAIESEREFGLSVLRRLDEELSRRGELLRDAGVQDLAGYRKLKGESALPRVLLVVDEFQEFFTQDDKIGSDAALLMDRLVRQGRAFGLHVLLGSQTLGGAFSIARSTIGQMGVRIALQCAEADSYLILSEDNSAARLLTRPGEAIYNDASGLVEGNSPFQIAWLDDEQRSESLGEVAAAARSRGRARAHCVVFEGNQPADVRANPAINRAIDAQDQPGAADSRAADRRRNLWLGEPLAIKPPAGITLRRESAANTLLVGGDADAMAGMISAALLSAGAWAAGAERPVIRVVLASSPDEAAAELLPEIARRVNADIRVVGARQAEAAVREMAGMLDAGDRDPALPPALLVIWGLQRCRDLRRGDEFDFSAPEGGVEPAAKALARLLVEGPAQGIHTLAWCDTLTNLERTLDRAAIREFGTRVVTQMSPSDSTTLIDSPAASDLGRHRALLHVVDAGVSEKFRPYRAPDRAWLEQAFAERATPEERDPLPSA